MKNISGKNGSKKLRHGTDIGPRYWALRKTQGEICSVVAMATILAPVSFSFELNITICDSIMSERRTCSKHTLCPYGCLVSSLTIKHRGPMFVKLKNGNVILARKRLETKPLP